MKVQLNKEEFCKYINKIVDQIHKDDEFNVNTAKISFFTSGWDYDYSLILDSLLELLESACGNSDWVSWWLYENDCGKGGLTCMDKDNKSYDITTPEELWDFVHLE